ncbi:MAG: hypothetical protein CVU84_15975 [Firmicutes bacterium HGW-Firmicutes-1]|jgi:L-lactate permease|nr:MAG: hypothetical protein CVU84_15975 [Firmicutes bacterium HGW-Firmicutes-1]
MVLIIIFVYLVIGLIEIIPLYKDKKIKELWMYVIIIGISFIISILLVMGVNLPKPASFIEKVLSPLVK